MRIRTALAPLAAAAALLAAAAPALAYDNSAWIPMLSGNPPMVKWIFSELPNGNAPQVDFVFQTPTGLVSNAFGFDVPVPKDLAQQWMGHWDDPAPLLWYAQHVDPTWLGWRVFGWGPGPDQHTPLSPQLIATLNAEHFTPSMVGGYDVPGLTAGHAAAPSSAAPAASSAPSGPAQPSASAKSAPPPASASSPTQTAPTTSSAPSSAPGTALAPAASPPSGPPAAASAAPASATVPGGTKPTSAGPETSPPAVPASASAPAATGRPADPHRTPSHPHGFPWPEAVGAVLVLAAGGYGVWRWRQAR